MLINLILNNYCIDANAKYQLFEVPTGYNKNSQNVNVMN